MKSLFCQALSAGTLVAVAVVLAAPPDDRQKREELMKQKLKSSKAVLEAITAADYKLLLKEARQLRNMAATQWTDETDAKYRMHLENFWTITEGLQAAAEDANLDRAAIGNLQLTLSCVDCHKYLRRRDDR